MTVSLGRYEQWWLCWGVLVLALGTVAVGLPSASWDSESFQKWLQLPPVSQGQRSPFQH